MQHLSCTQRPCVQPGGKVKPHTRAVLKDVVQGKLKNGTLITDTFSDGTGVLTKLNISPNYCMLKLGNDNGDDIKINL
jgi:hypothetical protein